MADLYLLCTNRYSSLHVTRDKVRRLNTQYENVPSCACQIHFPPFCDQRRRGRDGIILQAAIQLVVIKMIMHQNII